MKIPTIPPKQQTGHPANCYPYKLKTNSNTPSRPKTSAIRTVQAHLKDQNAEATQFLSTSSPRFMERLTKCDTETEENFHETMDGKWSLVGFAARNFFDYKEGRAVDRDTFNKNMEKLVKNKREFDPYEFVQLAEQARKNDAPAEIVKCLMAMSTKAAIEIMEKRAKPKPQEIEISEKDIKIVPKIGFNLELAFGTNEVFMLPSNRFFYLHEILTTGYASRWTSSKFKAHCRSLLYVILDNMAQDNYFPSYAANVTPTLYIPFTQDFIDNITFSILRGFRQNEDDLSVRVFTERLVRETMENRLSESRKEYNKINGIGASRILAQQLKDAIHNGGFEERSLFDAEDVLDARGESMGTEEMVTENPEQVEQSTSGTFENPQELEENIDIIN